MTCISVKQEEVYEKESLWGSAQYCHTSTEAWGLAVRSPLGGLPPGTSLVASLSKCFLCVLNIQFCLHSSDLPFFFFSCLEAPYKGPKVWSLLGSEWQVSGALTNKSRALPGRCFQLSHTHTHTSSCVKPPGSLCVFIGTTRHPEIFQNPFYSNTTLKN